MSKKFEGYYTYNASPLDSYYRIDKKYTFHEFKDMNIVVMEIPGTSDFHCQIQPVDKDGDNPIWLRSNLIDSKDTVDIYNGSGGLRTNLRKLYRGEFEGVDTAFCGFSLSPTQFPLYDIAKKPAFLIADIFANGRWLDFELMEELLTKYKIPTLPILYKGVGNEDIVKSFLGQKSHLSSTKKISSLLIRTFHEALDEKSQYTRKSINIVDNLVTTYNAPIVPSKKIELSKEKDEDEEEAHLLDVPLDTCDDINDFINSELGKDASDLLPLTSEEEKEEKILNLPNIEVLKKTLKKTFDLWSSDGKAMLEGYFELSGQSVRKHYPEDLFNMGLSLREHFENFLKSSENKLIFERMKKMFTEKIVTREAQEICFMACQDWFGL